MTTPSPLSNLQAIVPPDVLEQARDYADGAEASVEYRRKLREEIAQLAPPVVPSVRVQQSPAIPSRFTHVMVRDYEPRTPAQVAAKAAVVAWIREVQAGGAPRLALIGPPGTGKSHLLYAATRAL